MRTPANILLTAILILSMATPPGLAVFSSPGIEPAGPADLATGSDAGLDTPLVDIRVNAGGSNFTDSQGKVWQADQAYAPGSWGYTGGSVFSTTLEIEDTVDDPLYQGQRSMSSSVVNPNKYLFDLPNGVYEVELRFAEIYCTVANCRTFTVRIENLYDVLTNFDPFAVVGFRRALNATFLAPVADNQLEIKFISVNSKVPIVNAIRVTSRAGDPSPTTIRLNAGGYDYRDAAGNWWIADQKYITGTRGFVDPPPPAGGSTADKTVQTIANTADQPLLQRNRYGMTGYTFDMPNGAYRVDLHLAELYASINSINQRVFDVWAEGSKVIADLDVFRRAGNKYRAITETFGITVLDSQLNITFTKKITSPNAAIVNAISIQPLDNVAPGSWANFTPTDWQTTQSPAASIQVSDALAGLNVSTGQYAYSTNGGSAYSAWLPASVSGSTGTTATQTISVGAVPFGQDSPTQNKVKFRVSDISGNIGESPAFTVQVDALAPTSTILAPLSGTYANTANLAVSGSANDAGSGVQAVEYSIDNGASWQPATGLTTWSAIASLGGNGVYAIRSRARDVIGHVESPGPGVTVTLDTVPPATFIRTPANGQMVTATSYLITGTAFDVTAGVQRVEVSVDGGASWVTATGTTSWSYNWTPGTQGNVVLRARAVDRAGNVDNPGTTVNVVADSVAPTSTIVDPANGRAIRGPSYSISGFASDDGSGLAVVDVSVDGATWHQAAGLSTWVYDWDPLPADGPYTVRSRARDLAGFVQNPPVVHNIIVDNTPPSSAGTLNGALGSGGWYTTPVTFSATATDATSGIRAIHYRLDAGSLMTYTAPVIFSAGGNHVLTYFAVDLAGNSEAPHTASFAVDIQPPATTHTLSGAAGENGWFQGPVTVVLSSSDGASGLRTLYYRVDGGPWQVYSSSFVVSAEGTHTLQYYATDMAGNSEPVQAAAVRIDSGKPSSSITADGTIGANGWYVSPVTFQIIAADGVSGLGAVYYRINGGSWIPYQSTFGLGAGGQYMIEYYAVDQAGNREDTHSIVASIDRVAPVTSHTLSGIEGNGGWYRSPVVVTLSPTDADSGIDAVVYSINGGPWQTYDTSFSLTGQGTQNVAYHATDVAGNEEASHGFNLRIDSIVPIVTLASPINGQVVDGGTLHLQGTAADPSGSGLVGVEISFDGGAWITPTGGVTWNYFWNPPSPGVHNIRVRALDAAGNTSNPGAGIYITVDTSRPASAIASPYNGQIVRGPTTVVTGTATDTYSSVAQVEVSTNGGANWALATLLGSGTWVYTWTVPSDGSFNLRSRATDRAGNVETPGPGITVQVDSVAPVSIINSPLAGQYIRAAALPITGTASDAGSGVKRVEVSIDGGPWLVATGTGTWEYVWSPVGGDGPHVIRSRGTDNAGNVETPGAGVTITIDNGKPTSTILQPRNGQVIETPQLLIAGTSADLISPVRRVEISLQRGIDGFYWDGSDWSPSETWLPTSGDVSDWSYLWTGLPTVMMATIRSRATDNVGNVELPGAGVTISIQRGFKVALPIIVSGFYQ